MIRLSSPGAPLLASLLLLSCTATEPVGPNLILITIDTLRPDRLGCYGGAPDVGHAICGVGAAGHRYLWAFSAAPSTAPAVASILTSRYPSQHGVSQFATTTLSADAQTVAEALSDAGYSTAAFIANPVLDRRRRLDQGFEIYDAEMTRLERNRPTLVEREAESLTDAAIAWAGVAAPPWFLWIHYQDPHGPYDPPGAPPPVDRPNATRLPLLEDHSGHEGIPAYQRLPGATSIATYEARYADEIQYLDANLARLLPALDAISARRKSRGARADPTPGILITADHAEAFGEDGYWFAHGHSVGLDQIRVPLLWRPPGGAAARSGAVVEAAVSTIDVAPTLLAAAGVPIPASFEGRPLPVWTGSDAPVPADRVLFAEHRLRAAVIGGKDYLARDRRAMQEPVRDRVTGGWLHALPPRSARLPEDGRLPSYRLMGEGLIGEGLIGEGLIGEGLIAEGSTSEPPASGGPAKGELERQLDAFIAETSPRVEPDSESLSPKSQEQLRALGYLE